MLDLRILTPTVSARPGVEGGSFTAAARVSAQFPSSSSSPLFMPATDPKD
jgi:hypothetical protein